MKTASIVAISIVMAALAGCGGGGGGGSTPTNSTPTVTLSVSPASITSGSTATLSWTTTNATSVSIDKGVGVVTPVASGSVTITPTATTTYTATATGSGGSATAPATVTVTAALPAPTVTLTASPTSVASGSSATLSWTTTNATSVSINNNVGVVTPVASGSVAVTPTATTTYTATATGSGGSAMATATVTVTPRVIAISFVAVDPNGLLSPDFISPGAVGGVSAYPIHVATSGAQVGDILTITDFSGSGTATVNAANITAGYVGTGVLFCGSGGITCTAPSGLVTAYEPHFVKIQVASADGTILSNVLWKPLITDQPTLAISKDGTTAYFVPGFSFPVQEYLLAFGTNTSGTSNGIILGIDDYAIAVDNQTGDVLAEVSGTEIQNSGSSTTLSSSNTLLGIAALNGYGYVTEPDADMVGQINNLSQMAITSTVATEKESHPWAIDAATVGSTDFVAVYSEQDTTIRIFDNSLTPISSLALTGVTGGNTILAQSNGAGGWPLRFFQSGTVALLSSFDKLLVTATLDSTQTLHLAKQATLTGNPIGIAKDETHQKVVVWYADPATGMTTMQSFDLATLTGTSIASASTLPLGFLASDVIVSSDGTKLYVGGINFTYGNKTFYVLNNQ
jgi:carbon monoxide dehydrogenase subunit G